MWKDRVIVLLKEEFEKRRAHAPRFSVRKFAKDLNLSASALSELMGGHPKWNLTIDRAVSIISHLRLSLDDERRIRELIAADLTQEIVGARVSSVPHPESAAEIESATSDVFQSIEDSDSRLQMSQLLRFAKQTLHEAPADYKEFAFLNIQTDSALLKDIFAEIQVFREKLSSIAAKSPQQGESYSLILGVFPSPTHKSEVG